MKDTLTYQYPDTHPDHFVWLQLHHLPVGPGWDCIVDEIFHICGYDDTKRGNRKPKLSFRDHMSIMVWNAYDAFCIDPDLWLAVKSGKADYRVKDIYGNSLGVSSKIIDCYKMLFINGLIDLRPGNFARGYSFHGKSRCTRVRATTALVKIVERHLSRKDFIIFNKNRPHIVLKDKRKIEGKAKKGRKKLKKKNEPVSYEITPEVSRLAGEVEAYQTVLDQHDISVVGFSSLLVWKTIKRKRDGDKFVMKEVVNRRRIGRASTFVYRVFNDGCFNHGGRYYGPWWQQIPQEWRAKILIDGEETVELDYSGLHIYLTYFEANKVPPADPYTIDKVIFPGYVSDPVKQRGYVKTLILTAINAKDFNSTCAGFRMKMLEEGSPLMTITNTEVQNALNDIIIHLPEMKRSLCKNRGVELMNRDSEITRRIIKHFTERKIPVLTVHDSYIVKKQQKEELKSIMDSVMFDLYRNLVLVKTNKFYKE